MSWKRVRGHEAVLTSFQRIAARDRLAHAYLFTGPSGIGKKLFAVELAKSLMCDRRGPSDPLEACDECHSCKMIEADTHPDFVLAQRPAEALEFPIAVMREVCQRFAMKSARGAGKVAIIENADELNEESANCFLKTLEEPPPRSVIILLSASPDRQLTTIVSRCQVVRFTPLADAIVESILAGSEHVKKDLIPRLVSMAEGSPGRALALSDPALWEFRQQWLEGLSAEKVRSVALAKEWTAFVEAAGKESAAQRARASLCIEMLLGFLREALRVCLGEPPRTQDPRERESAQALARRMEPESLMDLIERCLESDHQVDRRVQLVLILESLMNAWSQRVGSRAG